MPRPQGRAPHASEASCWGASLLEEGLTRVQPILHFKERDIWDIIHKYKIPFCSLYYQGYRSLGIKSNTKKFLDIPAWQQDVENTTERDGRVRDKEESMSKLRDLGYM